MPDKSIYQKELDRFNRTVDKASMRLRTMLDAVYAAEPRCGRIKVVGYGDDGVKLLLEPLRWNRGCVYAFRTVEQIEAWYEEARHRKFKDCGAYI